MCGIAGIVGPGAVHHRDRVEAMVRALGHRGPDESGVAQVGDAVLGVARLAVIDPAGGHQPLRDPDTGTVLVGNGEIYGYPRLKARFGSYPWSTGSDLEVVLPLYRERGSDLLDELPGTFSLAVWDDRRRELLLARDRFGERPLYWCRTADGLLVFASEISALDASGLVRRRLDRTTLAHVLRQGYVPPGHCIWSDISSLPPAFRLRFADGSVVVERWWEPPAVGSSPGLEEATEWFRAELDRAVAEQLEADVPVGAFLSGGVDSSTIAVLANRHRPGLDVFAFDMPESSEVAHARAVAERHGMNLHVCRPDFGADELPSLLGRMAEVWDEPFADSSSLPTWLLCRFARQRVTVALTGDGADELLGGYLCWARGYLEPDDPARGGDPVRAPTRRGLGWRRRRPVPTPGSAVAARYARFRQYMDDDDLARLGLPAVGMGPVDLDRYRNGTADDISRFDIDHYLPGDILVKTDRASMANSLEVRSPFLDVAFAEGCLRLPSELKVDARSEKLLLRRAFGAELPSEVVDRPKQGFGAPMDLWLGVPSVRELCREMLVDPASPLFELVDRSATQDLAGGGGQRAWNLLTVALWWARHRKGASA